MKQTILALLALLLSTASFAQLNVTTAQQSGNWADYYVQNVLLGTGVTAFNITFTGADTIINGIGSDSLQIGEFTEVNTGIDLNYGLVLGSGNVENSIGIVTGQSAGPPGNNDNIGDPDLAQLVTTQLHNTAILEFDFVPQGDTIRFDYVFGSDEYPTFVCQAFNDVFGFFLSGPGISGPYTNGAENLAVLPGTTTPVAINTINDVPGGGCNPACPCNTSFYVNNQTANNQFVTFNGMTVKLTAESAVSCGDTFHIKMAIADAGDGFLDSGVFLEGGSFSSNVIEVAITSVNGDSTINEGCGTAAIQFFRTDTTDTSITPLIFTGTATNGLDFTFIPDSIVLLPGVFDTTVVIDPFNDGLNEGMEFITIQAITLNPCGDTFISEGTLYFFDVPNLNISLTDTVLRCPTDSVILEAMVIGGGPPPYDYTWSTGSTNPTITIPARQSNGLDTLTITVLDSCALFTLIDTLVYERNVAKFPRVIIAPDTSVDCPGDTVHLQAFASFGSGASSLLWQSGNMGALDTVIVSNAASYMVSMTDSCGRMDIDTVFVDTVLTDPFTFTLDDSTLLCPGDTATLRPIVAGGIAGYDYGWALENPVFDDSLDLFVQVFTDTLLVGWARDVCGRITNDTTRVRIQDVDPLIASLPSKEVPCSGVEVILPSLVSGGLRPYSFRWSVSDTDSVATFVVNLDDAVLLTVTDFCGRTDTALANIDVPEFSQLGLELSRGAELCFGEDYIIEARGIGGAGDYTYEWTPQNDPETGEVFEIIDDNHFRVKAFRSGLHLIQVRDFCGNTFLDSLQIVVDPCLFIPNIITPNGDGWNDYFLINNSLNIPDAKLTVYNRWGGKVFESEAYQNEWTPVDLKSGVYYYILTSEFFDPLRGDVTIINN